jgi:hypothetical protein
VNFLHVTNDFRGLERAMLCSAVVVRPEGNAVGTPLHILQGTAMLFNLRALARVVRRGNRTGLRI